jgi:predicted amidohydrolase
VHSAPTELTAYLAQLAELLEAAGVHLLVLPELSVTGAARAQLEVLLTRSRSLVAIVAGSFHVWRDGHDSPFNEAAFCLPRDVAWTHQKSGFFRVTRRDIAELGAFFPAPIPGLQPQVVEGIRRGSVLHFWDTRIGRIALLICADAIAKENVITAIERCRPNIVLLPSMSMKTAPFEQLAESLTRHGISVFYVNAGSLCELRPETLAAFVHLGLPALHQAPPTRFRWLRNQSPEAHHLGGWRAASNADVEVVGKKDGIIIDLTTHLRWRENSGS